MKKIYLLLLSLLLGCSTPIVRDIQVGGVAITEHLDTFDSPCVAQGLNGTSPKDGCHIQILGRHHVWYSSVSPKFVLMHEWDHAFGMEHSKWDSRGCAYVTVSGRYVHQGELLCQSRHSIDVYDLHGNYLRDSTGN